MIAYHTNNQFARDWRADHVPSTHTSHSDGLDPIDDLVVITAHVSMLCQTIKHETPNSIPNTHFNRSGKPQSIRFEIPEWVLGVWGIQFGDPHINMGGTAKSF